MRRPRAPRSVGRHALLRELLERSRIFREMREAHTAQHVRSLRELNVGVADDLDAIAPRVDEIEKRAGQRFDSRLGQCLADKLFVVDNQAEVSPVISGLRTAFLQRY